MSKLVPGVNDLLTTHPAIAAQAHGWDPTTVTAGSGKKMVWACSAGHPLDTWESQVCHRTNGKGCPVCAGRKVLVGFNDLVTTHPAIAAQAHRWDPTTVTAGSGKKMAWACSAGHPIDTWGSIVADRTNGKGCPVCAGRKVLVGFNDLATTHPEIAAQAHGWDPRTITAGSHKKVAWACNAVHPTHIWKSIVVSRKNGSGCPVCAGNKVLVGFNDLATTHPAIAVQAHGWDPTTVTAGSGKKMAWACRTGHPLYTWKTVVGHRTNGTGCPVCAGKKVLVGFNDLATSHPEIAAQAHGWDPRTITAGSNKKRAWACSTGHSLDIWDSIVANRTNGKGCPVCAGKKVLVGFNDLATTHPEIAAQAHGWDPRIITAGSDKKMAWACSAGHPLDTWESQVCHRTNGKGCPVCAGRKVLVGFNDLVTTHPAIAAQAHRWDPTTVTAGSGKKMAWACSAGHPIDTWGSIVADRTNGRGCPVCVGKKVFVGFNDLATTHPAIAAQAHAWDPTTVTAGSGKKMAWACSAGHPTHIWKSRVINRKKGSGCPVCASTGYKRNQNGFIYLMARFAEQQIGITNNPEARISVHQRDDWKLIELAGPFSGELAWKREKEVKQWLKNSIGTIDGTTENWETPHLEVSSLAELYERAGLSNLIC